MSADPPHSQWYFTDARDHWWNDDFIALMARRLGLSSARRVIDAGSGQGHFARVWAPHLAPGFEIVCVDPEERSLAVNEQKSRTFLDRTGLDGRFTCVVARVEQLPFDDGAFDVAMCQTLLMHLRDPSRAVAEMTRVVRTGGTVLAAEPNNLASLQSHAARGPDAEAEPLLREAALQLVCTRGKYRLELGWNNLGVHLPRLFENLRDVRYWCNDLASALTPPYDSPDQRAAIDDMRRFQREGVWIWPREEARRYYVAGGGDPSRFDAEYDDACARNALLLDAIDRGACWDVGGHSLILAAGRKV